MNNNSSELKQMNIADLEQELESLHREQFNLRMQRGSGEEIKPHLFNKVRKNIARIKTIIREKQLESEVVK